MADTSYFYTEGYYEKKDGKRISWKRVRLNEVDSKIRNPSQNYNCFATVQRYKNAIEERGENHIADLYFDLDGKVEDALADAIKLIDYFGGMGIGHEGIRVWFTGKKGFHILISSRVIGVSPHPELTYIHKGAAFFVAHALALSTFDHSVYTIKRVLRLPGSIHRDTGRFKTEFSHLELKTMTVEQILKKSEQPTNPIWEDQDLDDLAVNETAEAWYSQFRETYEEESTLKKLKPRIAIKVLDDHPVCVRGLLASTEIPVAGNGNKAALALASYFKDKGRTEEETLAILEPWVTSLTNTSTSKKPREAVASLRSVVHSVFFQPKKYGFACAFIRAVGNTEHPIACQGDMCPHVDKAGQEPDDPIEIHLSQASRSEFIGKRLKIQTTISGKDTAPFIIPRKFEVECSPNEKGKFCAGCPSVIHGGGKFECEFKTTDEGLTQMCNIKNDEKWAILRRRARVPANCKQHSIRILDNTNIEEVRLIPQLDFSESGQNEYVQRLGFYVGHGIKTSQRYDVTGYTIPDPRTQAAVHVFEDVKASEQNIQTFSTDRNTIKQLRIFQPAKNESIDEKFADIHADLEANITKIHRRTLMAMSVDLIYHTVLQFSLAGSPVDKGWGELLILGDSGQAKSTLIKRLRDHYQAGEILNGESASRTGLLYTLTESTRRWLLVWGRIPLNDMSLLVIDEASGLSHDDIAQMSGARASGIAEVNRVGISAKTPCRTRLIFSSNPRTGKPLRQYQWPILAVCGHRELIDKSEDVRRFDLAIAVKSGDVPPDIMNRHERSDVEHKYTGYLCNLLVRWVWSRKSQHIEFSPAATDKILAYATQFAGIYHSSIPIVEPADQRHKIARLSVAVAARLFSTDDNMEKIIINEDHVDFAVGIMNECFFSMGYDKYSSQMFEDTNVDEELRKKILEGFSALPRCDELAKSLMKFKERPFTKRALQDQMDYTNDHAREVIHYLAKNGLIEYTSRGYVKKEFFIEALNEITSGRTKLSQQPRAEYRDSNHYGHEEYQED